MCVIQGTSQTGSKKNFPFPIEYRSHFSLLKSQGVHRKGRGLNHSVSPISAFAVSVCKMQTVKSFLSNHNFILAVNEILKSC